MDHLHSPFGLRLGLRVPALGKLLFGKTGLVFNSWDPSGSGINHYLKQRAFQLKMASDAEA